MSDKKLHMTEEFISDVKYFGSLKEAYMAHAEEALATAAVCLMSGHHDCPTVITVNADKLENCLMSLTLSIQSLQKHAMLEKA